MSPPTVADIVVDGLGRAGTPRLFCAGTESASSGLCAAALAAKLPVTRASGDAAACVMAAVSGDLVEAPGAALLGAGRDVTAAIAAVERARIDRAPMIVLTECHATAVPACKASLSVTAETASHWIAHASRLAMTAPRGPVHLDVPADVAGRPAVPMATSCRPDPLPYPDAASLDAAAGALSGASRPVLLAGLHCRTAGAVQWLRALAEALPAPLLSTARAKGALPDPHPLMLGVLGAGVAERLLGRADLAVAIGLDAHERVPRSCWSSVPVLAFGPPQAADDPVVAVQVHGDVEVVIEELAARLRDKPRADWDVAELDRLRREGVARIEGAGRIGRLVRLAREATPAGTIATVDADPYRDCVAATWQAIAPREFLVSNELPSAGFALPAAIAAHLVHPERRVICFTDAAGLAAAASELETAVRLDAPLVVIVLGPTAEGVPGVTRFFVDTDETFGRALGQSLRVAGPALIAVST